MEKKYKLVCLCCLACIPYLFLSQSLLSKKTVETKNQAQKTVNLKEVRETTLPSTNPSKLRYKSVTKNQPADECSNFVSASCNATSNESKFKKLPEKFAKVSFKKMFFFLDVKITAYIL